MQAVTLQAPWVLMGNKKTEKRKAERQRRADAGKVKRNSKSKAKRLRAQGEPGDSSRPWWQL